jgi:uncharacterized membrane protein
LGATGWELVDLVARWIHVIAGIMWVGNSMLFNWLDRNLERPGPRSASGSIGEIWLLHSGAFYYVDKTLLGDQKMPKPMHWFYVQAFTTAISGIVLLIAIYWAGNRAIMQDSTIADLTHAQAVLVGIGAIVAGNILYQLANRLIAPRAPGLSAIIWVTGLAAISIALTQLLNGRAAFLHIGAMVGLIMAANVAYTILPSQRALVAAVEKGGDAGEAKKLSDRAKRVSIHNNYFTFPVILLMVSNHFSTLYSNRYSWALVLIIFATGGLIRHIMNIRFVWAPWKPALAFTGVGGLALLYGMIWLGNSPNFTFGPGPSKQMLERPSSAPLTAVTFGEVRHVIDRRCAVCHSQNPVDLTFGVAPAGVMFDTEEQIMARRSRILERAVVTRTMPPANKTRITDSERAVLDAWARQ